MQFLSSARIILCFKKVILPVSKSKTNVDLEFRLCSGDEFEFDLHARYTKTFAYFLIQTSVKMQVIYVGCSAQWGYSVFVLNDAMF